MDGTERNVKTISCLLGVHGALIVIGVVLYLAFYPWFVFGFYLFPFFALPSTGTPWWDFYVPVLVVYGLFEMAIAWGLCRKEQWARMVLVALSGLFVANWMLAWLDQLFYSATPMVYCLIGVVLLWYMTRENVKAHFSRP